MGMGADAGTPTATSSVVRHHPTRKTPFADATVRMHGHGTPEPCLTGVTPTSSMPLLFLRLWLVDHLSLLTILCTDALYTREKNLVSSDETIR